MRSLRKLVFSLFMSELRKIVICQSLACQGRGSKQVLHRLRDLLETDVVRKRYPKLIINTQENCGDCEQGPIVYVNDSIVLRRVDADQISELIDNPSSVLGGVMHVLEQDRETFERIVEGELY